MLEPLSFFFDQAWRWKCGLSEKETLSMPNLTELLKTEKSDIFEQLKMNRKVLGAFRYGRLGAPNKSKFNRAQNMIDRLKCYINDGNLEHLVDVANLCELEFVEGTNAGRELNALADHNFHAKEVL